VIRGLGQLDYGNETDVFVCAVAQVVRSWRRGKVSWSVCVLTSCRSVVSRTEYSAVPGEEARQIAGLHLFALSGRKTGRTEIMFHGVLAAAAIHSVLFDQGEYQTVESRI